MKIRVSQKSLSAGIQTVQSVVSSRSALPILSNVLIEAVEGKLIFRATDLDISISTSVPAIVFEEGAVTVPAKRFSEIVKKLPNISVSLEVENHSRVTLKSERGIFKIMSISKEEFPNFPEVNAYRQITFDEKTLKRMIQKTAYAASSDDARPALNGVLLEITSGSVNTIATDGRRLAWFKAQRETDVIDDLRVTIPPKVLKYLTNLLGSGDVEITLAENYIVFQLEETTIYSRLIAEPFPDYKQVIPSDNDKSVIVNREEFTAALRRVSIFASQQTNQMRIHLQPDQVELSVNTPEIGEAKEEVSANYTGEEIDISYNAIFLLDILRNIDSDELRMEFSSSVGAGVFIPVTQEENEDYMALCMPLRSLD